MFTGMKWSGALSLAFVVLELVLVLGVCLPARVLVMSPAALSFRLGLFRHCSHLMGFTSVRHGTRVRCHSRCGDGYIEVWTRLRAYEISIAPPRKDAERKTLRDVAIISQRPRKLKAARELTSFSLISNNGLVTLTLVDGFYGLNRFFERLCGASKSQASPETCQPRLPSLTIK